MISFFKSKPRLFELIPEDYVDIHSHILFGIDDGAKTISDTEFLLQAMVDLRFSKCITTPHTMTYIWENTNESINNKQGIVCKSLPELTSTLKLVLAESKILRQPLRILS